jgi:hypothetical protein
MAWGRQGAGVVAAEPLPSLPGLGPRLLGALGPRGRAAPSLPGRRGGGRCGEGRAVRAVPPLELEARERLVGRGGEEMVDVEC